MKSFTVHMPAGPRGEAADKAVFVPDGFSTGAFVFSGLWLVGKRLWLAFAGYLVALAVLAGIGYALRPDPAAAAALSLLINVFLGFEGNDLWRRDLERRGLAAVDVATGRTAEEAESRFFTRFAGEKAVSSAPTVTSSRLPALPASATVLGMFPMPGGRS